MWISPWVTKLNKIMVVVQSEDKDTPEAGGPWGVVLKGVGLNKTLSYFVEFVV